ncbi:MAG: hypothetical protein P8R37_09800 [Opitutae bacterium]|nr:hypothetical protein [Opitutae bacterium]MDG1301867.1 hypothetical protein [Opitutae bacterium]
MSDPTKLSEASIEKVLMEVLIRFGLIALLIYLCAHVFAPFTGILLWGLIMSVALYPLHQKLAKRLGGKQGGGVDIDGRECDARARCAHADVGQFLW